MMTTPATTLTTEQLIPMLLERMYIETMNGRAEMPMAAICKKLAIRMSTLQRHLTLLESHALVTMHCDDAGRWTTALTEAGMLLFAERQAA